MSGVAEGDGGGLDGAAYELSAQKPHNDLAQARHELAMVPLAPGTAGGFVVDPERAQWCIDELTRIVEEVRLGHLDRWRLAFDPPGYDQVSVNLARNGALMARRAEAFVAAWASQIEATRDALQRQLDDYRQTEQTNAGRA